MDFDSTNKILYTGDEMGNMHKWNLANLIDKLVEFDRRMNINKHSGYGLQEFKATLNQFEKLDGFNETPDLDIGRSEERKTGTSKHQEEKLNKGSETDFVKNNSSVGNPNLTTPTPDAGTFLTSTKVDEKGEIIIGGHEDISEKDVYLVHCWKAHVDGITWVTFNENPSFIVSSSFDKNVYIWNENCEKIGSLVLGHDKHWNIDINKMLRQKRELEEAEKLLLEAEKEDDDGLGDKDRSTRDRDMKIMEQIKESQRKRNMRRKAHYDD
jgi:WD40 repeat protein